MSDADWQRGDLLGQDLPVHLDALRRGGPAFLTTAFRAAGTLGPDDEVTAITALEPFAGGSTGRKALLSVTYAQPGQALPEQLFVKFSRDFDDERRDQGKGQMEAEVRFGLLSQLPDFPVSVPRCLFAEYHLASGSGILISERIPFGSGGIEPHHAKARDHEVVDLVAHYDALVTAMGRLAGAHRAGRFPEEAMAAFAPRPTKAPAERRLPPTPEETRTRVLRYVDFAASHPQLLPDELRSEAFLAELLDLVPRSIEHDDALRAALAAGARDLVAFCHWNANIDNAWFWRDERGDLACGLLDWGNVGQVNVVTALSSALVFTEPEVLVEHLDHFLALFATVVEDSGGGRLDPSALRRQFDLQMVAGGLQWPLGAMARLERHVPDLARVTGRFDPRILDDEHARTQLHLLTAYLTLWRAADPRRLIDEVVGGAA